MSAPGSGERGLRLGLLVLVVGMTQTQILPGELHWLVRVVHLGSGLVAMASAETLGLRIRAARRRRQPAQPMAPAEPVTPLRRHGPSTPRLPETRLTFR